MSAPDPNLLGVYLRDRRARLDPAAFGFSATRRRTPGLRREEVAQRANVSATWYTWLEQGRGGAPSTEVLERIAGALALSQDEREHLFLLAQHRPPVMDLQPSQAVSPRLQRVMDALVDSPALVKNATWDVIAWNHASTVLLTDYGLVPPAERNILKVIFCAPHTRRGMPNWERDARFAVAAFRSDSTRAGARVAKQAEALAAELSARSPEFAAMWNEHDVRSHGEGTKHINRPGVGAIAMDYSHFVVDGQPDLGMIVYTPATEADRARIATLLAG
ncbi:Helix-turn-helix domain-containing protein [Pseudoxanthomonas sp. GM95]|uniref:helix-turn-helix transcriptional regulator n=1 Tax=Pseudoxanthomonas sp. GM95 TaxID=1881043 RepID=UPI0008B2D3BF|nr:helix-turn-helix transcriptional regulator [Pseudoxanthomonas sp. GM95]SEL75043.1 Helix-turn-helix domain-containing protein [Pseudoxanthomonas sp. GM95]